MRLGGGREVLGGVLAQADLGQKLCLQVGLLHYRPYYDFFIFNFIGNHLYIARRAAPAVLLHLDLLKIAAYSAQCVLKGDSFFYVSV